MELKGWRRRKGYPREARFERSVEQTYRSRDKNRVQGGSIGRAGHLPRSPYPSRMRSVDPPLDPETSAMMSYAGSPQGRAHREMRARSFAMASASSSLPHIL